MLSYFRFARWQKRGRKLLRSSLPNQRCVVCVVQSVAEGLEFCSLYLTNPMCVCVFCAGCGGRLQFLHHPGAAEYRSSPPPLPQGRPRGSGTGDYTQGRTGYQ